MGMNWAVSAFIAVSFLAMSLILTWQVAGAGILRVDTTFEPMMTLMTAFGGRAIDPRSMTVDTVQVRGFRTDISQLPMPNMMNALRIAGDARMNRRKLSAALGVATVIALVLSSGSFLYVSYRFGGNNLSSWNYSGGPYSAYSALVNRLVDPSERDWIGLGFIGLGAVVTAGVTYLYTRFLWWPLHPIGCATGSAWGVQMMLLSIFLGWAFKAGVLRFGGLRGYQKARPLFLGLVFGEYVVGGLWLIVGLFTGKGYAVLPN